MLTKQSPEEITVKCHIRIEETDKVRSGAAELLGKNFLTVRNAQISSEDEVKPKVEVVVVRKKIWKSGLEKVMSELYDLEGYVVQEKPLKIELDLDLYQMEKP